MSALQKLKRVRSSLCLVCASLFFIASPSNAWVIDHAPAKFTLPASMTSQTSVGWLLFTERWQEPLIDPTITYAGQTVALRGSMTPGARLMVSAEGKIEGLNTCGLSSDVPLKPFKIADSGDQTIHIDVRSEGSFDFRLLPAKAKGWNWPDGSFEESRYKIRVMQGEGSGAITSDEANNGDRSLYMKGSTADAMVIAESPYVALSPAGFGRESGLELLAISVKVQGRNVQWPQSNRHGLGPRVSLRYFDADHKYLFQAVLTNRAGINPVLQGTTEDYVHMRGAMSRLMANAPIRYVKLRLSMMGEGEIWFDDLQLQPMATLFKEQVDSFRWVLQPELAHREAPSLSEQQQQCGFAAFRQDMANSLLPGYVPLESQLYKPDEELRIEAAIGETTSASVGVWNATGSSEADLSVGSAEISQESDDHPLPGDWVKAQWVDVWLQKVGTIGLKLTPTPELLLDDSQLLLQPQQSRQIWLTLRVPPTAKPGTYRGQVSVLTSQGKQDIPVTLQVRPFSLVQNKRVAQEMFYHYTTRIFNDKKVPENIMRAEFADMVDHGINMIHTQRLPGISLDTDGRIVVDIQPMQILLDGLSSAGLNQDFPLSLYFAHFDRTIERATGVTWTDPRFAGWYAEAVEALDQAVRQQGFPGLLLRMEDEPGNYPHIQKEVSNQLEALTESAALTYMNTGHFGEWAHKVAPMVDVMRVYALTDEVSAAIKNAQNQFIFASKSCEEFELQLQRLSGGLVAYKAAANHGMGVSWYTYRTSVDDPYKENNSFLFKSEMTAYPDPQTGMPRPTIQWEMLRMASNDLRYLLTLDETFTRLEKEPSSTHNDQLIQQAVKLRQEILQGVPLDSVDLRSLAGELPSSQLENYRSLISGLIIEAQESIGRGVDR